MRQIKFQLKFPACYILCLSSIKMWAPQAYLWTPHVWRLVGVRARFLVTLWCCVSWKVCNRYGKYVTGRGKYVTRRKYVTGRKYYIRRKIYVTGIGRYVTGRRTYYIRRKIYVTGRRESFHVTGRRKPIDPIKYKCSLSGSLVSWSGSLAWSAWLDWSGSLAVPKVYLFWTGSLVLDQDL